MRPFALAALLTALSSWAAPPIDIGISTGALVVQARSYDFVDDDDHLGLWRVETSWTKEAWRGQLQLGLGGFSGATKAAAHQTLSADLWLRGIEASATYRYPALRWLEPYARAAVALEWATLSVLAGQRLEQTALAPVGSGLLGVDVVVPLAGAARRALVLDLGVGYAVRSAYQFDELKAPSPAKPGPENIPRSGVPLGALQLSGITYRIGVALRL